jgi:hypothetical protein
VWQRRTTFGTHASLSNSAMTSAPGRFRSVSARIASPLKPGIDCPQTATFLPAVFADDRTDTRRPWLPMALGIAILAALATYGAWRLGRTPTAFVDNVRLRIMQPNLQQDDKFNYSAKQRVMSHYLELSDRSTGPQSTGVRDATHLIWPESAFPFLLTREPDALAQIAALIPEGTVLITGAVRAPELPPGQKIERAYNSIYVIDHDGSILSVYDKVHLVPFGEYLPFQSALERLGLTQLTRLRGGFIAGAVLIVFGIAAIVLALNGGSTVNSSLKAEKITGSSDMTPAGIKQEVAGQAWATNYDFPSCSVADKAVTNGSTARCFAQYMRIHALEATGGLTYAQMPRYATADGKGTNDPAQAAKNPDGSPQSNAARNIWVTETALTTALYTSYFGENVALFAIIVGIALLLGGIGFAVLIAFARRTTPATAPATDTPPDTAPAT